MRGPSAAPAPASPLPSTTVLTALARKAEEALKDLTAALHAFIANRTTRLHGALSLAVAHAQHVAKALEVVREQRQRQRQQQQQQHPPGAASSSLSFAAASPSTAPQGSAQATPPQSREEMALTVRLDKIRVELRRVLPRAVAAVEEGDGGGEGKGSSTSSAASTAAALRSLLHTRSMLSVELQKMETAVNTLAGSGESLSTLHRSLEDVHASMATAQRMVRTLLTVQSRDDLLLRLSFVVFAVVIAYILVQRVGRLFPSTMYVAVEEAPR